MGDLKPNVEFVESPKRWLLLFLVSLNYFVLYIHRNLFNYIQPSVKAHLALEDWQFGVINQAFVVPYCAAQIVGGYLSDRFSRRYVLLGSVAVSTLAVGLMGYSTSFTELVALRVLLAFGQSCSVPAMAGAIADVFAPRNRGFAFSIYLVSFNSGLIVAGGLGGSIADVGKQNLGFGVFEGWQMVMLAFSLLGAAIFLTLLTLLDEPPRTEREAKVGLGRGGSILATTLSTLKVRSFLVFSTVFVLAGMVKSTLLFWFPRYLTDEFGMTMGQAGVFATSILQPANIAGLFLGGYLGDRLARGKTGRTTILMIGIGLVMPSIILIGLTNSRAMMVAGLLLFGIGIGLYQANIWAATFEVVDPAARSTAIGLLNVASGMLGSWVDPVVGYIHASVGGFGVVFASTSALALLAVILLGFARMRIIPGDLRS